MHAYEFRDRSLIAQPFKVLRLPNDMVDFDTDLLLDRLKRKHSKPYWDLTGTMAQIIDSVGCLELNLIRFGTVTLRGFEGVSC